MSFDGKSYKIGQKISECRNSENKKIEKAVDEMSCVTFASIATRYRFQSAIIILLMLSCVISFALIYLFLAMYAFLKNCWNCSHVLLLSLVFPTLSWFLYI